MNPTPRAHLPRVDVAGSTDSTLEALRRRSEVEGFELVEWPSYAALAEALEDETDSSRRVLLCPSTLDEIPAGWIRRIRSRCGGLKIVVLVERGDTAHAHQLQLEGASTVHNLPLNPSPVGSWFHSRDYLASLYRETPRLSRWESHRLSLPSERGWIPSVIRLLCDRFEELGWSEEMVRSVLPLVVDEAVSNAMGHGNAWDPGLEVRVYAVIGPSGYRIEVQDQGAGFVREEVRNPVHDENLEREGGRGLFLLERLVDEVRYEDGGRRIVLRGGDAPEIADPTARLDEAVTVEP